MQAMPGGVSEKLQERSSYPISGNATESGNRGALGVGGRAGVRSLSRIDQGTGCEDPEEGPW